MTPRLRLERCADCPPRGKRCAACVRVRRLELDAARAADPVRAAAETARAAARYRERKEARPGWYEARQARQREARAAARVADGRPAKPGRGGRQRTRPRCEACPEVGLCKPCYNRDRQQKRAAARIAKGLPAPVARSTPQQRAERADQKRRAAEHQRELAAARKAQAERQAASVVLDVAAQVARDVARPQPCLVCLARGRHENGYCARCQGYAKAGGKRKWG